MKQIKIVTLIFAMGMVMAIGSKIDTVQAAGVLPKAVIAVIDTRQVRLNSAAGKDIQNQLEQIRKAFQAEIQSKEKALKKEKDTLEAQRSIMAPDAFTAKGREFQAKLQGVQLEIQNKNRQLEAAISVAETELQRALKPILQAVLKNNKATVIFDKSLIIEQAPGLDVTTEVIEQLDAVLPSVKVQIPNGAPAK